MNDTRTIPCERCGGDKGFDVPHDIDRRDGGLITHWVECSACGGTGDMEIEIEPIDIEDLDAMSGCINCGASLPLLHPCAEQGCPIPNAF